MSDTSPHRGVMITFSQPADGVSEEAFNDWYDNEHVKDILKHVDGVVAVRRYRLCAAQPPGSDRSAAPYLAIYELDRPAEEVLANFAAAGEQISMSDVLALGDTTPKSLVYDLLSSST